MARYVIDARTLLHIVANGIQLSPRHQIVAPNVIRSQALSLLFEAVRKGELTEALALVHHERLTELKMRLLGDRVSRRTAWRFAREQNWDTTYDAEFLAVTQLQAADATHFIARPIERRIRLTGVPFISHWLVAVSYPPIRPFDSGLLAMPDGNQIYWELSGNPRGKPALFLHGGPGSGLGAGGYRSNFDPERYLIVGIDQRGCGRSRPLVIDSLDQISSNTTQAVIADIEAVRMHLNLDRWLLCGISWGTTLALAYALTHPDRVTQMILAAVTTTSRAEVDWITETVGRIFPEAWARFEAHSGRRPGERVVEAYARRLAQGDIEDRRRAAQDWDHWESVHVSLDPNWHPGALHEDPVRRLVFATLVTHYWAHDGFLPSGGHAILERVGELADIPAVLIHGRRDVSGPSVTPWLLHQSWTASDLVIIESEGHGGPVTTEALCLASDAFAR